VFAFTKIETHLELVLYLESILALAEAIFIALTAFCHCSPNEF
jgi:hypothetical protein